MYYVYMLRCDDNSIYTGITTDINRRMKEHFTKSTKCAKYTFRHTAKKLESAWIAEDRKSACKLEYYLKTLNKKQKESLIKKENNLNELFSNKIECDIYNPVDIIKWNWQ